jgi:hypothetical protein
MIGRDPRRGRSRGVTVAVALRGSRQKARAPQGDGSKVISYRRNVLLVQHNDLRVSAALSRRRNFVGLNAGSRAVSGYMEISVEATGMRPCRPLHRVLVTTKRALLERANGAILRARPASRHDVTMMLLGRAIAMRGMTDACAQDSCEVLPVKCHGPLVCLG